MSSRRTRSSRTGKSYLYIVRNKTKEGKYEVYMRLVPVEMRSNTKSITRAAVVALVLVVLAILAGEFHLF